MELRYGSGLNANFSEVQAQLDAPTQGRLILLGLRLLVLLLIMHSRLAGKTPLRIRGLVEGFRSHARQRFGVIGLSAQARIKCQRQQARASLSQLVRVRHADIPVVKCRRIQRPIRVLVSYVTGR